MNEVPYLNAYWISYKLQNNGHDGWNYVPDVRMPLGTANYLDERLDEAYITIPRSTETFFRPTTEFKVELKQYKATAPDDLVWNTTERYYVVASDDAQVCPINYGGKKPFWRHELYLVEITKLLEGIIAEVATYTNTSGTAYADSDWVVTG